MYGWISTLNGGELLALHSSRFSLWEGSAGTHWLGDWMRPQGLSGLFGEKRTLTLPGNELRCPCFSARSRVVYWLNCLDSSVPFYLRLAYTKYTSRLTYLSSVVTFLHTLERLPELLLCLHFTPPKIYDPLREFASNTSFKEEHLVWS